MVGVSSSEDTETYLVNIYLPNKAAYSNIRVAKGILSGGDILIGMNIIATGDFAITSPGGVTQFSFRVPGQADIDFVREHNAAVKIASERQRLRKQKRPKHPKTHGKNKRRRR